MPEAIALSQNTDKRPLSGTVAAPEGTESMSQALQRISSTVRTEKDGSRTLFTPDVDSYFPDGNHQLDGKVGAAAAREVLADVDARREARAQADQTEGTEGAPHVPTLQQRPTYDDHVRASHAAWAEAARVQHTENV